MAGVVANSDRPAKKKPNPVEDMYKLYDTSVNKQAGDYDDIMSRFRNLYDSANAGGPGGSGGFTPYSAERAIYNKSPDTTAALANLKELTETGGLSGGDQQNLRARGISPIRSMYATAQRDLDRNRRLSGGYSPNFGAVTAKMTRDQSSLIADQMDKVNANIAEMVQSGKLSAAPNYASAAQAESALGNSFSMENAKMANDSKRFNAQGMFDSKRSAQGDKADAARGMTQLYGTTPALPNLYGDQAQDARNFDADQKQKKRSAGVQLLGGMMGR